MGVARRLRQVVKESLENSPHGCGLVLSAYTTLQLRNQIVGWVAKLMELSRGQAQRQWMSPQCRSEFVQRWPFLNTRTGKKEPGVGRRQRQKGKQFNTAPPGKNVSAT